MIGVFQLQYNTDLFENRKERYKITIINDITPD
jgi:hypothetical protein